MSLKSKTITDLQKIMRDDYGKKLTRKDANDLGKSLLFLSRLGISVLTRVDENISSFQVRGRNPLKSNTST